MNYMLVKIPNSKNRDKFRSQLTQNFGGALIYTF